mmetsp:Transcript_56538/g.84036  ORF Transcript_56538/g.84036 Transcript_56538/m.84036 type:complete len:80 (+) Transcript_56538:599-838(+)
MIIPLIVLGSRQSTPNIILSWKGVPAKVMSKDEVAIFEKTIKTFLNDAIKSSLDADGDVEVLAVKKKKRTEIEKVIAKG